MWALRGFSATIYSGEIVGIIGHNGAGKSTLLKLISRITEPSEGRLTIFGTLASLLEVGVGFHPDLTGRENVYLAGALLQLSKRHIEQSLSSIRDFAELGDAFDWPVRTYSSGMYMRLGFAVAVHLRSDIVLLDEVLAVGDLRFQQKCSQFLRNLRQRGVTILLVSHNLFLVKALCSRVLYLKRGQLIHDGDPLVGVQMYEEDSYLSVPDWAQRVRSSEHKDMMVIEELDVLNADREPARMFEFGDSLTIRMRLRCCKEIPDLNVVVSIIRQDGLPCCAYSSALDGFAISGTVGTCLIQMTIPKIKWIADSYRVDVLVWDSEFQKLFAAAKGPYIVVQDPLLSREFGVYHESAMWQIE
ncbi:MAG: ABC transporter ATP-binding protein [Gemmatales bacterium]|nr:ABC transporter ATP-binding protein [Gemmatales bacterium]